MDGSRALLSIYQLQIVTSPVPVVSYSEDLKLDLKLNQSTDPMLRKVHEKWTKYRNPNKSILEVVEDYEALFLNSKASTEYNILKNDIDRLRKGTSPFHIASEFVSHMNIIFPLKKGSPLRDLLSEKIMLFNDMGLISKWADEELRVDLSHKTPFDQDDVQPLTIKHLQGPFLVMLLLFCGCVILFAVEKGLKLYITADFRTK